MKVLFLITSLLVLSTTAAHADHSMQTILDMTRGQKGNNLYQAVTNLQKAISTETVCDFKNSTQIRVPDAANTSDTWRQTVLCFANSVDLEKAHKWLDERPLKAYGLSSTYGLRVSNIMDVTYKMIDDKNVKLISISYK